MCLLLASKTNKKDVTKSAKVRLTVWGGKLETNPKKKKKKKKLHPDSGGCLCLVV